MLADKIESYLSRVGIGKPERVDLLDAYTTISGDDSLIAAAPITESGETMLKLNRNLRISGHNGNRIFISPFSVCTSKKTFEQFRESLIYAPHRMKYQFFTLNQVFIGHNEGKNSWEEELSVVETLTNKFWKERDTALRQGHIGLEGKIGTPSITSDEKLEFTQDFAFWGKGYDPEKINPEAVYLTMASILQGLREKPYKDSDKDSLFSYVYQHSVISPDNFSRFTDGLLQSCLWRSACSRELDYRSSPELSKEFSEILLRLINENATGNRNSSIDLLMGIAVERIKISDEHLRNLIHSALESYKGIPHVTELLNYITEKILQPNKIT